jgi:RNA polymerase sigma-70 factor (ECF subfamily)
MSADAEARWSDWMRRAQQGDRDAYEKLMNELAGAIETYLQRRFGRAGAADFVEECVQETLLVIHRARHTYDPKRRFRPWLFTLARHKAIDLLRRQRARHADEGLPEGEGSLAARVADPAHGLDGATVLDALDAKYREALELTKLEGCSLPEAAARAGVTLATMKSRVHRAIRIARRRLGAEEVE